jgi:hypothetical protein
MGLIRLVVIAVLIFWAIRLGIWLMEGFRSAGNSGNNKGNSKQEGEYVDYEEVE